jgi:DNA-binding response OmpR family regulator
MPNEATIEDLVVLLADSSLYMRKLTRMMLLYSGVRIIHEVADGAAALEAIQTIDPDVMIIDWDIEILSGREVLRMVRSPDTFSKPNLPVIMLTNVGLRSRVATAVRLGAHDILVKPTSPRALRERLVSIRLAPRPMIRTGNLYIPMPHRRADLQDLIENVAS